jgi:hypothetical protein
MIDKADLRGSRSVAFRPEVQKLVRDIDYARNSLRFRPTPYYIGVADLRPDLGIDAILHAYCKHGPNKDHKLEIIDTGKKSVSDMAAIAESVFDCDANELELMRLDLCADVTGTKVSWFLPRTRVKYKRFGREIGTTMNYAKLGHGDVETIMAGKSPNVFRIYDKVTESKMQFKKLLRKTSPDAEPPDFEREFGFKESAIITRVERQHGGRGIPPVLSTFGALAHAPDYNPFEPLEIMTGAPHRPAIDECSGVTEYFTGIGMNVVLGEMGMQQFRPFLNRHSGGNAARMLERYRPFLAPPESELTSEQLYGIYRESVIRQLAA